MLADSYLSEGGVPRLRRRVQERNYYVLLLIKERGGTRGSSQICNTVLLVLHTVYSASLTKQKWATWEIGVAMQLIYDIPKKCQISYE